MDKKKIIFFCISLAYLYLCAKFKCLVSKIVPYSINVGGELLSLEVPIVMGILNATPDSFYQHHEGTEAGEAADRSFSPGDRDRAESVREGESGADLWDPRFFQR